MRLPRTWAMALLAGMIAIPFAGLRAQTAAQAQPQPPAVPPECGSLAGAGLALPNSALAIQNRKQLRILAIGAAAAPVVGSSRDGKPPLL